MKILKVRNNKGAIHTVTEEHYKMYKDQRGFEIVEEISKEKNIPNTKAETKPKPKRVKNVANKVKRK